jgi:hypothetical protein
MSKKTLTYEGFTVSAKIEPAEETDLWSAVLTIASGEGKDTASWIVSAGDTYASEEEAARRCFDFAREMIDREMKGCSLD